MQKGIISAEKQAWRKNPRRFAPKSKKGCKTCKVRRIKCDQTRPSCLKCHSTGRVCDGYPDDVLYNSGPESELNDSLDAEVTRDETRSSNTLVRQEYRKWQTEIHDGSNWTRNLRPFMFLPSTGHARAESMDFFQHISIKHLNKYRSFEAPWSRTLMLFSQTIPSVRHAATAFSLLHRSHTLAASPNQDLLDKEVPMFHYTRAIQLLLQENIANDSIEQRAIVLLVCYLFTCFDYLAGNGVQAMRHIKAGVKLSCDLDKMIISSKNRSSNNEATSSDVQSLVTLVTGQIRRFDMQTLMFALDWTPDDMHTSEIHELQSYAYGFCNIEVAVYYMDIMIAQVMKFRNAEPGMYPTGEISSTISPSPLKHVLLERMKDWSHLFENMLQLQENSISYQKTRSETDTLVSLLRLQYTVGWIILNSCGPGKEMEYDAFLPQFQECIILADNVVAGHEQHIESSKSTFTPEIGLLPLLYIVGAKCRDPTVRRQVVKLLRRQMSREAVWNSLGTAKVIERVIEIEEGAIEGDIAARDMYQIAVWQRIEAMSWTYIVNGSSLARLDWTYTFCDREGVHTEPLFL